MLFCSQAYVVFFALVFGLYWAMPWSRPRIWLLLASSFFFYATWNRWLACLIALSTLLDFLLARSIDGTGSVRMRKLLLTISIAGNLGLLCYFKYANFFLHSVEEALCALGTPPRCRC